MIGLGGERVIARTRAKEVLAKAYASEEPSLVAVVGRRRIGKTFLIREVFKQQLAFHVTGIAKANLEGQLANYQEQLRRSFPHKSISHTFKTWLEALSLLADLLEESISKDESRRVVFFDELPWLASRRSGFLQAFSWFWNSWAFDKRITVVICGSAASWMINKVVRDKGSLHNRITHRILLKPFTLGETALYFDRRGVVSDPYHRLQLYMALGGVPFYLKQVEPGASAAQEIDRLLFAEQAPLQQEFELLFTSLFDLPERHINIVMELARHQGGMLRQAISKNINLPSSGTLTKVLEELDQSGFIDRSNPYKMRKKGSLIRLIDEFSMFYLRWIRDAKHVSFQQLSLTPSYASWAGFAYERIALKHVKALQSVLGISGLNVQAYSYFAKATDSSEGVQIDLLLDRPDRTITLVEAKFATAEFTLTKAYAADLKEKVRRFRIHSKTKKHIQLVLLTTYGLLPSKHAEGLIDRVIGMQELFLDGKI